MSRSYRLTPVIVCLAAAMAGCEGPGGGEADPASVTPVHVDSIRPIGEELRRFRAEIRDSTDALSGGARSIPELTRRFVVAFEHGNRAALDSLAMTPAEFAYLYYPHTRYTRRPYELPPALVWFQLENYGSRGLSRAFQRYGNRPLLSVGYICPEPPVEEGPNRLHHDCMIRVRSEAGDTVSLRLFGAIIERDGRFKFVNYANRL